MEHNELCRIRRVIGICVMGIIPLCLVWYKIFGNLWTMSSVNSYSNIYWTNSRNLLVAGVGILAYNYFMYPGYNWLDKLINWLCAILIIGSIFCPAWEEPAFEVNGFVTTFNLLPNVDPAVLGKLHLYFGRGCMIAQMLNVCLCFTRSDGEMTKQKKIRNWIYYGTGIFCVLSFILISWDFSVGCTLFFGYKYLCITLQILMFIALGLCWFIKGEGIKALNDK